jgi:hypothetical protein
MEFQDEMLLVAGTTLFVVIGNQGGTPDIGVPTGGGGGGATW